MPTRWGKRLSSASRLGANPTGETAVVCRQTRCRLIHRPGAQVVPRKGEKALSNLVGPFRNLRWTRSWGQQLLWVRLSFSVFYAPSLPDPLFYPIQSTLCLRPSTPSTLLHRCLSFCIFYLFFVCMSTSSYPILPESVLPEIYGRDVRM